MKYDVIVVGAGMAGLTAAAYLTRAGVSTLLIEKDESCGGLVGSFKIGEHVVDKGARGIIDSGIVFPMLKQLGLTVEFLPNPIQMIMESERVLLKQASNLEDYELALKSLYPKHHTDIEAILSDIKKSMGYMDVLYGIENPLFLPQPYSQTYLKETLLPWMLKFIPNISKAMKMMEPIEVYLSKKTNNKALISMISQHFFEGTPTFFALSYFSLYLQYHYPKGSTQTLVDLMTEYIQSHQGHILNSNEVIEINPVTQTLKTHHHVFDYQELIWSADTNHLYKSLNIDALKSARLKKKLYQNKTKFAALKGADSILTLYVISKIDPNTVASQIGAHGFVTLNTSGLSQINLNQIKDDQGNFIKDVSKIDAWIYDNLKHNTFEISIPSLRDPELSPRGETALIISTLFDYHLVQHLVHLGHYETFKTNVSKWIIEILEGALIEDFKASVLKTVLSTPLTIEKRTNASQGSVTGWSFTNRPFPVKYKFLEVSQSVKTGIQHITQAGQWTFNPSGVPVAILTGKLAADAVLKSLKKANKP